MRVFSCIIFVVSSLHSIQVGETMGMKSISAHMNSTINVKWNTTDIIMPYIKQINTVSIIINLTIPSGCEVPTPVKTNIDLLELFSSQESLAKLSIAEKKSIILILISNYDLLTNSLPSRVIINLVTILSTTNHLFSNFTHSELNSLLIMITSNQYHLHSISVNIIVLYLKGLLSLSPGILNTIPKSVLIPILGMITSRNILNDLPQSAVIHIIIVISMSKSLFNCLPIPTLISILTYIADKPPEEILMKLPPSTLFGFLEGLLDTINDSSSFLVNTISVPILCKIINPLITSQMLGVMPINCFNLLLAVLGTSNKLLTTLSIQKVIIIFNTLNTSPKILSSVNPSFISKILTTVTLCPSLLNNIPSDILCVLQDTIKMYLSSSLTCFSTNTFELLLSHKN